VMNRMVAAPFGNREIEGLERRAARAATADQVAPLIRIARSRLRTAAHHHEALNDIRAAIGGDVMEIAEIADADGLGLIERIVERLDFEISSESRVASPATV